MLTLSIYKYIVSIKNAENYPIFLIFTLTVHNPATMKMFDDELTIDMKEYVISQSKERELPILIIMVTTESIKPDGGLLTSIGAKIDNFNKN